MIFKDLGTIAYRDALTLQKQLVGEVLSGLADETVLLLEHTPVYTIGRTGSLDNVLDPAIEAVRISRGGDITYHAPGQLVGYPIINLGVRQRDLRRYLRFLEEVLIGVADDFDVVGYRVEGKTGVWTDGGKLASIGAGARRWVTLHGFALNVSLDLSGFERINPCGMAACPMTTLARESGRPMAVADVKARTRYHFQRLLPAWLPLTTAV